MAYPEATINDTKGFTEFFKYVNVVSDGLFFPLSLLSIWVIIFFAFKNFGSSRSWTTASAICAFLSIPLAVAGLMAPRFMYLCIFLFAMGVVWLKLER